MLAAGLAQYLFVSLTYISSLIFVGILYPVTVESSDLAHVADFSNSVTRINRMMI